MNWLPILLLGLAAFFAGGAYSMKNLGNTVAMWILIALALLSLVGGALYAWSPA